MARYFPIESGRYEIAAGLRRFGTDFGGGDADRQVFQIDEQFERYRQQKLASRGEQLEKYYGTERYDEPVAAAVSRFIIGRLAAEHPSGFALHERGGRRELHCATTGERLAFDADGRLVQCDAAVAPPYRDALDALACQVQEDLAVVRIADSEHWMAAIHLCLPNHWAAGDKIGRSFRTVHEPVAEIEPINRREAELLRVMMNATDGLVRFAWGVSSDTRLNHHPEPPPGISGADWHGRRFDPEHPQAYLRIERQTVWGLPEVGAALFTIRTYFQDLAQLRRDDPERCGKVCAALRSMSPASLAYKGLSASRDALLRWLEQTAPALPKGSG